MIDFLSTTSLDLNHIQVIVRGMYRVAQADGEHESEVLLMRQFYEECRAEAMGLSDFQDLVNVQFDPERALAVLQTDQLKEIFIKSCTLLAYADGVYSKGERKEIAAMAKELGISTNVVKKVEEEVKDYLLLQVSKSDNIDSIKQIVSDLEDVS